MKKEIVKFTETGLANYIGVTYPTIYKYKTHSKECKRKKYDLLKRGFKEVIKEINNNIDKTYQI